MPGWLFNIAPRKVDPDRHVVVIILLSGCPPSSGTKSDKPLKQFRKMLTLTKKK